MEMQLIYPLEKHHLPINKVKRFFHALTPKGSHISYNGIEVNKECKNLSLTFEVENSFISYSLDDFSDECLPFTVEGKWHLASIKGEDTDRDNFIMSEEFDHITQTEKKDVIMDNDVLVDELETELEMSRLTDE